MKKMNIYSTAQKVIISQEKLHLKHKLSRKLFGSNDTIQYTFIQRRQSHVVTKVTNS